MNTNGVLSDFSLKKIYMFHICLWHLSIISSTLSFSLWFCGEHSPMLCYVVWLSYIIDFDWSLQIFFLFNWIKWMNKKREIEKKRQAENNIPYRYLFLYWPIGICITMHYNTKKFSLLQYKNNSKKKRKEKSSKTNAVFQ